MKLSAALTLALVGVALATLPIVPQPAGHWNFVGSNNANAVFMTPAMYDTARSYRTSDVLYGRVDFDHGTLYLWASKALRNAHDTTAAITGVTGLNAGTLPKFVTTHAKNSSRLTMTFQYLGTVDDDVEDLDLATMDISRDLVDTAIATSLLAHGFVSPTELDINKIVASYLAANDSVDVGNSMGGPSIHISSTGLNHRFLTPGWLIGKSNAGDDSSFENQSVRDTVQKMFGETPAFANGWTAAGPVNVNAGETNVFGTNDTGSTAPYFVASVEVSAPVGRFSTLFAPGFSGDSVMTGFVNADSARVKGLMVGGNACSYVEGAICISSQDINAQVRWNNGSSAGFDLIQANANPNTLELAGEGGASSFTVDMDMMAAQNLFIGQNLQVNSLMQGLAVIGSGGQFSQLAYGTLGYALISTGATSIPTWQPSSALLGAYWDSTTTASRTSSAIISRLLPYWDSTTTAARTATYVTSYAVHSVGAGAGLATTGGLTPTLSLSHTAGAGDTTLYNRQIVTWQGGVMHGLYIIDSATIGTLFASDTNHIFSRIVVDTSTFTGPFTAARIAVTHGFSADTGGFITFQICAYCTASLDLVTDANKHIVTNTITGTGSGVRASGPTISNLTGTGTTALAALTATTITPSDSLIALFGARFSGFKAGASSFTGLTILDSAQINGWLRYPNGTASTVLALDANKKTAYLTESGTGNVPLTNGATVTGWTLNGTSTMATANFSGTLTANGVFKNNQNSNAGNLASFMDTSSGGNAKMEILVGQDLVGNKFAKMGYINSGYNAATGFTLQPNSFVIQTVDNVTRGMVFNTIANAPITWGTSNTARGRMFGGGNFSWGDTVDCGSALCITGKIAGTDSIHVALGLSSSGLLTVAGVSNLLGKTVVSDTLVSTLGVRDGRLTSSGSGLVLADAAGTLFRSTTIPTGYTWTNKQVFSDTVVSTLGLRNVNSAGTGIRLATNTAAGLFGNATTIAGNYTWSDENFFSSGLEVTNGFLQADAGSVLNGGVIVNGEIDADTGSFTTFSAGTIQVSLFGGSGNQYVCADNTGIFYVSGSACL